MPALHQAAEDGDFDAVKRLLKYECTDVNETDLSPWRYTPLDYATQNGRIEVMKLLLQAGADPNKGLICAAQSGQIEAIKLLISLGAKVNGDQGSSPLYEAMSHKKWEAAKLLLAAGADIAKLKPNPSYLFDALASNELGILKLLIEYGVDINAVGSYSDKTLLSEAVKNNNLDAVKLLLEHGADVNIKYYGGETALRMAIWGNNVTVVKLLLEHGADINEKDSDGGTMLHKAIYEENVGVVKLLIDSKADVNAQSPKKDAPLNLAAENQGKYKYHEIENNKRMLEILELLLKAGANVNIQRYYDGETPLHIVTRLAYCTEPVATNAALKLLISYGANLKIGDRNGDTPLHDAVYTLRLGGKPMFEVIQILVQAGAPLGARNKYNKTPVDLMRDDKVPETEIIKLMESQGGKK
jgi:ankyrin repeat protein